MLPAVRFYTYAKRFEEAYTTVMRPLTVELKMAQPAVPCSSSRMAERTRSVPSSIAIWAS